MRSYFFLLLIPALGACADARLQAPEAEVEQDDMLFLRVRVSEQPQRRVRYECGDKVFPSMPELESWLRDLDTNTTAVTILPLEDWTNEDVVRVLDVLERLGFQKVSFAANEDAEREWLAMRAALAAGPVNSRLTPEVPYLELRCFEQPPSYRLGQLEFQTEEDLRAFLSQFRPRVDHVRILADRDTAYAAVQRAMELCTAAGLSIEKVMFDVSASVVAPDGDPR